MKRLINSDLLKKCIEQLGENALAKASVAAGVSVSTLQQMMAGTYPSQPQEQLRFKIIKALGVDMDDLFPLVEDSEAS